MSELFAAFIVALFVVAFGAYLLKIIREEL